MTLGSLKWWHYLLLPLGMAVLYVAYHYYANVKVFRYRLTMDIEADGKMHSASSIIEVKYIIGYDGLKQWNTQVRGVAPMIDLGAHGTIIAALEYDSADYARKNRAAGKVYKMWEGFPASAANLPLEAYGLHPADIGSAKRKVVLQKYPCIVWVPAGNDWRRAQQLFPEEVPVVVHRSIRIVQMTIEPATGSSVVTRIEPAPEWLRLKLVHESTSVTQPTDRYTISSIYIQLGN